MFFCFFWVVFLGGFFIANPDSGWVGIPNFYGFGSGLVGGQRVRFLVLSRLGADIQKFFQSGDRPLPLATALNIAVQIIDSLGNANNTRSEQNTTGIVLS